LSLHHIKKYVEAQVGTRSRLVLAAAACASVSIVNLPVVVLAQPHLVRAALNRGVEDGEARANASKLPFGWRRRNRGQGGYKGVAAKKAKAKETTDKKKKQPSVARTKASKTSSKSDGVVAKKSKASKSSQVSALVLVQVNVVSV